MPGMDGTVSALQRRLTSVDVLRGAVMAVMALDHVRDFFGLRPYEPEDLAHSGVALFMTRWVTHFAAPTFFLLAGLAIAFQRQRGKSLGELRRFLWTRGLWLVLLEVTVIDFAWTFAPSYPERWLGVIWALGCSMLIMSVLVLLPRPALAVGATAMVLLHNSLDGVGPQAFGPLAWLWNLLHAPGYIHVLGLAVYTQYPLVPWVAVMALGYVLGYLYELDDGQRRRWLVAFGLGGTIAFVVLRALDVYGDPAGWSPQQSWGLTVASFLNVTKYPPSLLFLLMTLGPALLALAALERARGPAASFFLAFGRVPMFYYLVHLYVIHALLLVLLLALGEPLSPWVGDTYWTDEYTVQWGLPVVYGIWVGVLLVLWPWCRRYARYKQTHRHWWLSYL